MTDFNQLDLTPIPRDPPSSSLANYWPISITSVLSKTLRCLSAWCLFVLDNLWKAMTCFQPPSLLIGKVWLPVMNFCACPIHCKVHSRAGRRLGLCRLISVQPLIGLTISAFSILYRLCAAGIGGSVLSILTQFMSNRSQHIMVDGCWSKLVDVVSGVLQGSVLGLLLFLLCTSNLFSILENKLIGYADVSTLMAVVPIPRR